MTIKYNYNNLKLYWKEIINDIYLEFINKKQNLIQNHHKNKHLPC